MGGGEIRSNLLVEVYVAMGSRVTNGDETVSDVSLLTISQWFLNRRTKAPVPVWSGRDGITNEGQKHRTGFDWIAGCRYFPSVAAEGG